MAGAGRSLGFDGLREFLADIFGADGVGRVWTAGFGSLEAASWHGAMGLDWLEAKLGGDASRADIYFCIGRMRADATGRQIGNVDAQPLLIVDDVGTKVDPAKWEALFALGCPEPTWRVETSPGNETWGWVLAGDAEGVDRWTDLALIRAYLVDRGLTDNVMDETRYVRLPGGWNSKPKYRGADGKGAPPAVKLAAWTPGVKVDVDMLGAAIVGGGSAWRSQPVPVGGMTGAQLNGALAVGALRRTADLKRPEPLIRLAEVIGLNPVQTRAGVVEALCPNMAAHSDRADTGFAFLGGGLAQCQHASCQGLRSPDFRALMEDAYEAQMAGRMALGLDMGGLPLSASEFLARADFEGHGVDFSATGAVEVLAEGEALADRSAARAEARAENAESALRALVERFIWVNPANAFFDTAMRRMWTKEQLDSHPDVIRVVPVGGSGAKRACHVLLNRADLRHAFGVTYQPGVRDAVVVAENENGIRCEQVNLWVPGSVGRRAGTPDAWLDLVAWVIPDKSYRDWFLDRLAFHVQRPGVVSSIIPLIIAGQGIGKDMMLGPVIRVLGPQNVQQASMQMLEGAFNGWQKAELVILPELKLSRDGKLYNALKDWTGVASGWVTINEKFRPEYKIRPVANFVAFSNHSDAVMGMDHDDRRIAVYISPAGQKGKSWYAAKAAALADVAELERIHEFLLTRPLGTPGQAGAFNHHAPAPDVNGSRGVALADTLSLCARWVYDECQSAGQFHGRKYLTVNEVEAAAKGVPDRSFAATVNQRAVGQGLKAAGCKPIGQLKAGQARLSPWFGPGMSEADRAVRERWTGAAVAAEVAADMQAAANAAQAALLGMALAVS